jgi:hypothetical protein
LLATLQLLLSVCHDVISPKRPIVLTILPERLPGTN